jgi:hypothetical protein
MASDPPFAIMEERLQESADSQQMTAYCAFCPKWQADGTAGEARAAAEQHRKEEHPETFKKHTVRRRRVFSQALTAEREAEIEEQRRQRMRSLGIA